MGALEYHPITGPRARPSHTVEVDALVRLAIEELVVEGLDRDLCGRERGRVHVRKLGVKLREWHGAHIGSAHRHQ